MLIKNLEIIESHLWHLDRLLEGVLKAKKSTGFVFKHFLKCDKPYIPLLAVILEEQGIEVAIESELCLYIKWGEL